MRNLIKYEVKKSLYPFIVLMVLNIVWLIFNVLSIYGTINKILEFIIQIGGFIIIIYTIKEIALMFNENENILAFLLPINGFKRFLSKFFVFCSTYALLVIMNILVSLYNKEHIHSVMYNQLVNGNQYIIYCILSKILAYISGFIVVAFVILLSNKITKSFSSESNQVIVSIFLFIGILFLIIFIDNILTFYVNTKPFNFNTIYSLNLIFKSGLSEIHYEYPSYLFFIPGSVSGSGYTSNGNFLYKEDMPSIEAFSMLVNLITAIILTPFVLKLSNKK